MTTNISAQEFPTLYDAQVAARRLKCSECDGPVEGHFHWDPERHRNINTVRCVRSRGSHLLMPKGKGAVATYLETGEGDAITRMQAERHLARQERRQQEEAAMTQPTTQIARQGEATLTDLLKRDDVKKAIAEALPGHIPVERFLRIALTSIRRVPLLAESTPDSFMACLLQAASVGLEVDTPLQHAHLIPFRNNKTNSVECTLILGYRGLVQLARNSQRVTMVYAEVVHDGDIFKEVRGLTPQLIHERRAEGETRMVGSRLLFTGRNVSHAYAVAKVDGEPVFVVLTRADLDSVRSQARASNDGPWVTHPEEMMRKTALRRLCKLLPLSASVAEIVRKDEEVERIRVIEATGEIVEGVIPAAPRVPPEPLPDCPEHRIPWLAGDKGGFYHAGGCTPAKLLSETAYEKKQWSKKSLDLYLAETYDGRTASKLTPDEVTEAYNFLAGIEEETPVISEPIEPPQATQAKLQV